jgi:uncharacterized membrane protein HdeD (DUF308 family)
MTAPSLAAGATLVAFLGIACAVAPVGMAVAVVLLCAGPHNWCEARYFLGRMPGRWGPLRHYFLTGIAGVVALSLAFVGLAFVSSRQAPADPSTTLVLLSLWHTGLIAWIAVLMALRRRQPPVREWRWLVPSGLLCLAAAWAQPVWTSVALVYLHPLLALVFLDRELGVRRLPWRPAYRTTLALIPLAVVLLWYTVSPLEAASVASRPEALQSGAFLLPHDVAGPVLATHVFLESVHYLVWIVAIPLTTAAVPWSLRRIPLAARSTGWRRLLSGGLLAGLAGVAVLWIAFTIDYETTRQVYFTVAIAHVLAEVPFLLRLL